MTSNEVEIEVMDIVIKHLIKTAKTVKNTSVKEYLSKFNVLPLASKYELIAMWLESQNIAVNKSISAGLSIMVPALGTFCVNQPSVAFDELKRELANDYGYETYRECPFEIKQRVNNEAKDKLQEQQEARREYRESRKADGTLDIVPLLPSLLKKVN